MEDPQYLRYIEVPNPATGGLFEFDVSRLRNLSRIRAIRFSVTIAAARERVFIGLRPVGKPNTEMWCAPILLTNSTGGSDQCCACIGGPPFVERLVTLAGSVVREDLVGFHLAALPDVWFDQNIRVQLDTESSGLGTFSSVRLQVEDIDIEPLPREIASLLPKT